MQPPNPPRSRISANDLPAVRTERSTEVLALMLRYLVSATEAEGRMLPPERELTKRFGVSRLTLREVMRVLEAESLVVVRGGTRGGAEVLPADVTHLSEAFGLYLQRTSTTVDDLFMARTILEPAAARMAARRRDVAGLRRALEAEETVLSSRANDVAVGSATTQFHDALLEASGSNAIASLGRLLDEVIARHGSRSAGAFAKVSEPVRAEALRAAHRAHERIVHVVAGRGRRRPHCRDHLRALHASTADTTPTTLLEMFEMNRGT